MESSRVKICPLCETWKPRGEYWSNQTKADGLHFCCTKCEMKNRKTYNAKERSRSYRRAHDRTAKAKATKRRYKQSAKRKARELKLCRIRNSRPDVKAKRRAYDQRPEVKAKKIAHYHKPEIKERERARGRMYYYDNREKILAKQKEERRIARCTKMTGNSK